MRFERELATAEALQRSLLPDRLPGAAGRRPRDALRARVASGSKVGGDWYDAVPLRDGRVMLVIGDVVGHGVRAAASMGKLRNVLQYSALDGLAPAAVLQRLNAYFCALTDADMATLLRRRVRPGAPAHPLLERRSPAGDAPVAGRHHRDARGRAFDAAVRERPGAVPRGRARPAGRIDARALHRRADRTARRVARRRARAARATSLRSAPVGGRRRRGRAAARPPRRRRAAGRRRAALRRRTMAAAEDLRLRLPGDAPPARRTCGAR